MEGTTKRVQFLKTKIHNLERDLYAAGVRDFDFTEFTPEEEGTNEEE